MFCAAKDQNHIDCIRQCSYCELYQNDPWGLALYPVPAIPLQVKYDYVGCVNIDSHQYGEDDPVIVYMYDGWDGKEVT